VEFDLPANEALFVQWSDAAPAQVRNSITPSPETPDNDEEKSP
jgi:hypothetical protein